MGVKIKFAAQQNKTLSTKLLSRRRLNICAARCESTFSCLQKMHGHFFFRVTRYLHLVYANVEENRSADTFHSKSFFFIWRRRRPSPSRPLSFPYTEQLVSFQILLKAWALAFYRTRTYVRDNISCIYKRNYRCPLTTCVYEADITKQKRKKKNKNIKWISLVVRRTGCNSKLSE